MAISKLTYSKTQWRLAIIAEATAGTPNVTTMQLFNIQDTPSWTRGAIRSNPMRSRLGRVAGQGDENYIEENQEKTCSFNCILGQTELQLLMENVTGNEITTSPAAYIIESGYIAGQDGEILIGTANTANRGTVTVALIPPAASQTEIMPGAIVRELSIKADLTANDTLIEASVTLASKHKLLSNQATPSAMVAYTRGSSCYRIFDFLGGACQIDGNDVVVSAFEFMYNNNAKLVGGACDSDGNPDVITRAIPEFEVTGNITVKYDDNTKNIPQTSDNQSSPITVLLADNATWSAATAGFKADYCWLTDDIDLSDVEEAVFFDIPLKMKDADTGNVIEAVV